MFSRCVCVCVKCTVCSFGHLEYLASTYIHIYSLSPPPSLPLSHSPPPSLSHSVSSLPLLLPLIPLPLIPLPSLYLTLCAGEDIGEQARNCNGSFRQSTRSEKRHPSPPWAYAHGLYTWTQVSMEAFVQYISHARTDWLSFHISPSYSRHSYIADYSQGGTLPDGAPCWKDFSQSRNNRFLTAEGTSKNRIVAPAKILHFYNGPPDSTDESVREVRVDLLGQWGGKGGSSMFLGSFQCIWASALFCGAVVWWVGGEGGGEGAKQLQPVAGVKGGE